jgi:hypothetical protein
MLPPASKYYRIEEIRDRPRFPIDAADGGFEENVVCP